MKPFESFSRLLARGVTREQLPSFAGPSTLQQEAMLRNLLRESRHESDLHTPLTQLESISLDTETTGFHPDAGDEVISVAAFALKGSRLDPDDSFQQFVRPTLPIPQEITNLTGIREQDVANAPSLEEVIRSFLHWAGKRLIVGCYLGHDLAFINHFLSKRYGARLSNRCLEVMRVVRFIYPELIGQEMDGVLRSLGIPISQRHTAAGDAHMTALLWSMLLDECQRRGIDTLGELYGHLSR